MSKYQWPASKLTEEEMAILFHVRSRTNRNICDLLKDAVHIAYEKEVKQEPLVKSS